MRSLCLTATVILFMVVGLAQTRKLYPVDESHLDPSFAALKEQLIEAAINRDRKFLRTILADEVSLAPGGRSTREQALESFDDEDAEVDLWRELRDVLLLGAARVGSEFCAPSIAARIPNSMAMADMLIITGKDVLVHTRSRSSSPVIDSLSYDVVEEGPSGYRGISPEEIDGETYAWDQVVTPSGKVGYVYSRYVRDWLDYQACFREINGKWVLVALTYLAP